MTRTLGVKTLENFARVCGGRLVGADRPFSVVSSDSRSIAAGELFVALRGPSFNGNEFVAAAEKAGAAGALVDQPQAGNIAQIVVADTQAALEQAASAYRAMFTFPMVGVAGSNGKTTVKEITSSMLAQAGNTLATRGNLNNHIGVPLTLFRLEPMHRFAVVEMGANHPGELAALVKIARPTIGLITNAGAEHLEGFGSIEGAARAEGEMVAGLAPDATAIINADDTFAHMWRGMTAAKVISFGLAPGSDFTATGIRTEIGAQGFVTRYTLECPLGRMPVTMNLAGQHNVLNSLCAAAAATAAGATLEHVAAGLGAVQAVKGRLQFKKTRHGAWLIDDSYNANPSSVHANLDVLMQLDGRKWFVFGQMNELGAFTDEAHDEIGTFARAHGVERLFCVGEPTQRTVKTFGPGAEWFPDTTALAAALDAAITPEVRVLVKGSRSNRLERVVEALGAATLDTTKKEG